MTREEKQKAINALKKSAPVMAVTQEEFSDYIQTINQVIDWLEQEPTTKNCESCRYYGSHHEVCNYCYKCSLWTEKEPTTKNDLGVDREDAVEKLNALKQFIGYDKDSEIVKATQKSLDIAIRALEQEPFINKPCVSEKVCEHDKKVIFDKIRAKIDNAIEFERKWLYDAGHISKDIDIALNAIKSVMTESETENGNDN